MLSQVIEVIKVPKFKTLWTQKASLPTAITGILTILAVIKTTMQTKGFSFKAEDILFNCLMFLSKNENLNLKYLKYTLDGRIQIVCI